jgi:hypothetical protein
MAAATACRSGSGSLADATSRRSCANATSVEESSPTPAIARTASATGHNTLGCPYGKHRPYRVRSDATDATSASTNRDLPIPGNPTTQRNRQPGPSAGESRNDRNSLNSSSRPTSGHWAARPAMPGRSTSINRYAVRGACFPRA